LLSASSINRFSTAQITLIQTIVSYYITVPIQNTDCIGSAWQTILILLMLESLAHYLVGLIFF